MKKPKYLSNGLRYHLVPMKGTKAATILVLVGVGSRYESNKVWGGSHFIEHLMFKGTKRRPTTLDITKILDRYGAEFNAYTGKDLTGYYIKITGDKIPLAVDLLHDMLFHSKYDPKEMKREKGVIVEEIKMYEENPIMHIGDLLEEAMFSGNRLGMEIAGSIESVKRMKRADVIEYRDSYYIPSEMTVVVAGNIPKDIKEILEKTFGRVPERSKPPGFEPYKNDEQRIRIRRQYKDLKQIQIALGFAMPGRGDKDLPVINLLSGLLGGAMSSRLFIEVRERRGLCYTIRSFTEAYADIGVFGIKAGLDAKRLKAAMKVIFSELAKIKKNGVTNKELQYIKDHVAGSLALGLENTSSYAEFVGRQELLLGEVKTPDEKLAEIQAVKRADIKRVAEQILDFNNFAVAAIGPYQTDEELMAYLPASIK